MLKSLMILMRGVFCQKAESYLALKCMTNTKDCYFLKGYNNLIHFFPFIVILWNKNSNLVLWRPWKYFAAPHVIAAHSLRNTALVLLNN